MIHFTVDQDPTDSALAEKIKDNPRAEEILVVFASIKDILELSKQKSRFPAFRRAQQQLNRYCHDHRLRYSLGPRPLVWDITTGDYLFDIKLPPLSLEQFRKELAVWKRS